MVPRVCKNWPGRAALALSILMAAVEARSMENSIGLATVSIGTWTTYGGLDGFEPTPYANGLRRYEFNKLVAMGLYGKMLGFPVFLGLPLQWTAKRTFSEDTNRVALGDLEFYLGRRLGGVETRLGMIFPAGYDPNLGNPWIGQGNVQATLGAALNPNFTRYSRKWEFTVEAKWAYSVSDGIAKAGSWGLFPGAKLSFRPSQSWKAGLEGIGYWKSSYWSRSASFAQAVLGLDGGPNPDWNAGVVPILFAEHYFLANLALGLKAGHSLWGYRDASSYNASIYLAYYP